MDATWKVGWHCREQELAFSFASHVTALSGLHISPCPRWGRAQQSRAQHHYWMCARKAGGWGALMLVSTTGSCSTGP